MSPAFERIYRDALVAEAQGLREIVGPGLGKALEFLIKDFAISENPGAAERIGKKFLGEVIKQDIADERLKAAASRAVWLRNDETHYMRRWTEQNLEDLKALIGIAMSGIEGACLLKRYEERMPGNGRAAAKDTGDPGKS